MTIKVFSSLCTVYRLCYLYVTLGSCIVGYTIGRHVWWLLPLRTGVCWGLFHFVCNHRSISAYIYNTRVTRFNGHLLRSFPFTILHVINKNTDWICHCLTSIHVHQTESLQLDDEKLQTVLFLSFSWECYCPLSKLSPPWNGQLKVRGSVCNDPP
jgi:hypothetical protein